MSAHKIQLARHAVIQAWLDGGFCPVTYAESIAAVERGDWDNKTPVQIALKALEAQ